MPLLCTVKQLCLLSMVVVYQENVLVLICLPLFCKNIYFFHVFTLLIIIIIFKAVE